MNHHPQQQRINHPYNTADVLSKLFFSYAIKLLKTGYRRTFTEEDLYEIPTSLKTKKLRYSLQRQWNGKNGVIFIILKSFGLRYLSLGLMKLLADTIFTIVRPYILEKLLSYISKTQTNKINAVLFVTLMINFSLVQSIFNQNYFLFLKGFAVKVRTTLCSLVYEKMITLKCVNTEKISFGRAVTLFTKDVQVFENFIDCGNELWVAPIKLFVISYILYQKSGPIILMATFFLILVVPIQGLIAENISYMKEEMLKKTDKRLQITQEALSQNGKIQIIDDVRRSEIETTQKLFHLKGLGLTIADLSSRSSLYVFIIIYTWFGHSMTIDTVFLTISCFSSLSESFSVLLPQAVYQTAELTAVIHRLTKFLQDIESLYKKDEDADNYAKKFRIQKGLTLLPNFPEGRRAVLVSALIEEILRKKKNVSYASREPWLFSSTIRQNVLFGQKYDDNRYQKVLEVCALSKDVEFLKEQDLTIVVNNGKNIDKSLKAKINLARAMYKQSQVYFFDYSLTDFGDNTDDLILNCHQFLQDKVVIFANHSYLQKTDSVVIKKRRSDDARRRSQSEEFTKLMVDNQNKIVTFYKSIKSEGVDYQVYKEYLFLGGSLVFLLIIFSMFVLFEIEKTYIDNLIGLWVYFEENRNHTNYSPNTTSNQGIQKSLFQVYGIMIIAAETTLLSKFALIFFFSKRVSIRLHRKLIHGVIHLPVSFLGHILNRFSNDLAVIDETIFFIYRDLLQIFLEALGVVILMAYINKLLLIPTCLLILTLIVLRRWCLQSLRNFRRLEATTRGPIIDYIYSTLTGLSTISAFCVQEKLQNEFDQHLDLNNSSFFTFQSLMRAFAFLQDFFCTVYIAIVVVFFLIVDYKHYLIGDESLIIMNTLLLIELLKRGIYRWTELEVEMIAMERILEYVNGDETCLKTMKNEEMAFENNCFTEESALYIP